ncbi:hypothetical protein [Epibacterium ulvae]|uniref:Lipoprotein n=1 Tax=Epibacterium ulvae TaxID=1156985 RepID=A0A1G5PLW2_9RHOB|nr:hypothetical protein [Epibacterium ulvae]SCZ50049.1 hypothetical protein SAMN04488118_101212 [Epibacterium ulvae]
MIAQSMKVAALLLGLFMVAGCGVDGEPIRPTLNAGVGVSSNGVHLGGRVGANKGPVSVTVGF